MLPDEVLDILDRQLPCREVQSRQLLALLSNCTLSTLILHGVKATGKSLTVSTILQVIDTSSAVIPSQECITTRHLLENCISSIKDALKDRGCRGVDAKSDGRCESISAFVVELQHLLEGRGKFILVFEGIDRQREAAPTLLPAIARLGEIVQYSPLLMATAAKCI